MLAAMGVGGTQGMTTFYDTCLAVRERSLPSLECLGKSLPPYLPPLPALRGVTPAMTKT
jgi:hypothetical protein